MLLFMANYRPEVPNATDTDALWRYTYAVTCVCVNGTFQMVFTNTLTHCDQSPSQLGLSGPQVSKVFDLWCKSIINQCTISWRLNTWKKVKVIQLEKIKNNWIYAVKQQNLICRHLKQMKILKNSKRVMKSFKTADVQTIYFLMNYFVTFDLRAKLSP